eukprot:CAMPEP_0201522984 /NCGR_PEP_ID=MMETSP0161_2-20130828/18679_1 /ASSEMBLY_ACC=CAM_ASM_000251 /TAXON_ID=180227 /ORGANISM="Neoparamoeba aestuarina, Strain SoJaBio B1-5/56/2" /LENGTH=216 /DNA_ID=CAMNT_0047921971 /DNA_START=13 /DNA_END=663 /DNA_ORIENTATION=-
MLLSMPLLLFFAVDPSLGRIDKSTLSHQTLMELFSKGIITDERTPYQTTDISTWYGVSIVNDSVVRISQECIFLRGTIDLEWLPSTVEFVSVFENELKGTLHLTALPEALTDLNLSENMFSGTVDLTALPEGLRMLSLESNDLSGPLDFTMLPPQMHQLYLSRNRFAGVCDFRHLPDGLTLLNVGYTGLEGELPLKRGQVKNFVVGRSDVRVVIQD